MNRMMRRICSAFLVLVMLLGVLPVMSKRAEAGDAKAVSADLRGGITNNSVAAGTPGGAKTLPYVYGFENNDLDAEGWTRVDCNEYSLVCDYYEFSGEYAFNFYVNDSPQYLISPEINSEGKDYYVSFYHMALFNESSFQVGYSTTTNDISAFTWQDVTPEKWVWNQYKADFSADVKFIAIKGILTFDDCTLSLDDFAFAVTGCLPPTDLSVSSITDQSATLTWAAPSVTRTITGYSYQLKAQDDSWGEDTEVIDSSLTSASFDNLLENTYYDFRVKTLYAEGKSLDYATIVVLTDASGSVSPPFSEDFENGMGAWRVINGKKRTGIDRCYTSNSQAFSFQGDAQQYLISPRLDCPAEIKVTFDYSISDKKYPITFRVGYSTTTKKTSEFTWGDEVTGTEWEYMEYTATFPAATKYIAIKYCIGGKTANLYIDNFNVFVEGVLPPTGLTVSNIACQSVTIAWDKDSNATSYAYQYRKIYENTWSDETTTTATSAIISGLMADTDYEVRLKAIYGSNSSIYTYTRLITATALPYEMNFENHFGRWNMVDCDINDHATVDSIAFTGRRTAAARDSNVGFQFDRMDSGSAQYLISPLFGGETAVKLSFYYRVPSNITETIYVGYSTTTNEKDAFTFGEAITFKSSSWTQYVNTFPAGARYFAIKYTSNKYYVFIDDINIEEYSPYAKPEAIGCTDLSETEATLGWIVPIGATGFIYQYKKRSDDEWSDEFTLRTNIVVLNGLTPNTCYNFRVKTLYYSYSSTYATFSFQTDAEVVGLPYADGFENGIGGWRLIDCEGATGIKNSNNMYEGTHYFYFFLSDKHQYLRSPHFAGGVPIKVSFYYKNLEQYYATLAVGYTSSKDAEINWVDTALRISSGEWTLYEKIFPADTQYVVLCCCKDGNFIFLDDIRFEDATPKTNSSVIKAPSAKSLSYNGSAQELVNAGTAEGGIMVYSLEENGTYSADIPTGNAVDTYKVWYYVQGDSAHNNTNKKYVEVKITKADIEPAVSVTGWTFGDNPNQLSVSGNPGNGDVAYQYKVQGADDNTYADDIPTEAGSYTVRASIEETQNYKAGTATANFTISKLQNPKDLTDLSRSISKTNTSVNASVATLVPADAGTVSAFSVNGSVTTTGSVMVSNVAFDANGTLTADLSNCRPGDTITIPVKITAGNYDCVLSVVISISDLANPVYVAPEANTLTYNGSSQALVTSGSVTTGGELQFSTDGNTWSASVPTGIDAAAYTVYYRVTETDKVNGVDPTPVNATIVGKAVTITADSAEKTYDGTALTKDSYVVDGLVTGDSIKTITISGAQIEIGEGKNTASGAAIVNAAGADVTKNYVIVYKAGALTVTKATTSENQPEKTPEEPKTTPEEPKDTPEEPKKTYTVIWLDGNGKELDKKEYIEGDAEPVTDKTPTKADADSFYFEFEGWDNGKVDGTTKTYTPTFAKKPLYTSEIGTLEYTMGENKEAIVRIIGNRNNTGLVGRVKSIGTDTKNAVFGTDVLLREGSLIMTFAPGYLDSLGVGEHMIRVVFDDGEVSFLVRILAAIATGTPTPAPADTTPVTGDALPVVPLALVMIVTFAGAAGMVMYRRKRG